MSSLASSKYMLVPLNNCCQNVRLSPSRLVLFSSAFSVTIDTMLWFLTYLLRIASILAADRPIKMTEDFRE
jgi:hypothetical protein